MDSLAGNELDSVRRELERATAEFLMADGTYTLPMACCSGAPSSTHSKVIPRSDMSITVLGATGQLGRRVLAALRGRGVPPRDIVAAGRDLEKIGDTEVRKARVDYSDEQSVRSALMGTRRVLLISSAAMEALLTESGVPFTILRSPRPAPARQN